MVRRNGKQKVVFIEQPRTSRKDDGGVARALVWGPFLQQQKEQKEKEKRLKEKRKDTSANKSTDAKYSRYTPKTPEIGKAKSYGFTVDDCGPAGRTTTRSTDPYDEETALQALRGWPRLRSKTMPEIRLTSRSQRPETGMSQQSNASNASDATNMPELMSHAYLRKWLTAKDDKERAEFEEELRKKQELKRLTLGKNTRASELRTLSIQSAIFKLNKDPKNMWQMSKFKNNAKPHLDTFRMIQKDRDRVSSAPVTRSYDAVYTEDKQEFTYPPPVQY